MNRGYTKFVNLSIVLLVLRHEKLVEQIELELEDAGYGAFFLGLLGGAQPRKLLKTKRRFKIS